LTARRKHTLKRRPTTWVRFEKYDAVSPSSSAVVCVPLTIKPP
jgi:hypothetical protein